MLAVFGLWLIADGSIAVGSTPLHVYVGTMNGRLSKGIYEFDFDPSSGKATALQLAAETVNPSFLTLRSDSKVLLAVGEINNADGQKSGRVLSFAVDPASGALTPLSQELSGGMGPCHVGLDHTERCALVSNYAGGSVAVLPIDGDGKLSPATAFVQHEGSGADKQRQKGPHAHSMRADPTNRFVIAADLGLDKLLVYRLDPKQGTLTPNDPPAFDLPPASGPRHFIFDPQGKLIYVINELASTIGVLQWDADRGVLKEVQTLSTLPEGETAKNSTAEVQLHPNGKFLYGSNRGHDSIAIFAVDQASGRLSPLGHQSTGGKTPRNFAIDPSGNWLLAANQGSGTIRVFKIDPATGMLQPTDEVVEVQNPTCVKFLPPAK